MKKATVIISSSVSDKKIAKVMTALWDADVETTCHCITAKDAERLNRKLEKYHQKMLEEAHTEAVKDKKQRKKVSKKNKTATKKKASKKDNVATAGKDSKKDKAATKGKSSQKNKGGKQGKQQENRKPNFPIKAGGKAWDDLEELHEYIN